MPALIVVGGGLFGSQAAAYARSQGIEAMVFDACLPGAASAAAAGLFKEEWAGKKMIQHFRDAVPVLDRLYGLRHITLTHADGTAEPFLFVPPSAILEPNPIAQAVTSFGDGWVEAGERRHEGWVYIAAGVWSGKFLPGLEIYGKAGSAFVYEGERAGRIQPIGPGRQAIAFVRDPGITYFGDGTAERNHTSEHDQRTLDRAVGMGLTDTPIRRLHGSRPYAPGGPVFQRLGERTWLATGGRKMGTILGAAFACRLVDKELGR